MYGCQFAEVVARAEAAESLNTTLQERFDTHTKAVGEFLGDLYMIMVDPCAEGETKVAEVKEQLLVAAIAQREAISLNTTLASRLKEAEEENETFRLAICGGEDAPGHAASLPQAVIVGIVQDNYANLRDRAEMAEARVEVLENARLASIKALMNTDPNTLAEIDVLRILDRAALKEPTL